MVEAEQAATGQTSEGVVSTGGTPDIRVEFTGFMTL